MELSEARGKLVAIGGAEDKEGDCLILKEFLRLAGGPKARLVVMTVATNHPEEVGREYKEVFKRLGVDNVEELDVSMRSDATSEAAIKKLEDATGIFFTGGNQLHVTSLIGGTDMQKVIHRKYEKGTVIGGTSAGASMMSNSMIISGDSDQNPRVGAVEIGPGMDLLVGAMIDTHFSQRGRHGRLLTAVAHYPQDLGIGLDENTAMIVNKNQFTVMGEGAVTVMDGGSMTYTNLPYVDNEEGVSLYDVKIHVLSSGHSFDFTKRLPIPQEHPLKQQRVSNSGKGKSKGTQGKKK